MLSTAKRVKTNDIWNFFSAENDEYAKCNICKKKISYKTTNSNMRKHMKCTHSTVKIDSSKNKERKGSSDQIQTEKTMSGFFSSVDFFSEGVLFMFFLIL